MIIAQRARDTKQRHAVEIEDRLGLRMIAGLHAIACQAQHVAHAHGGPAEDVSLDRDAILVAAGDLHDRRVTDARQQRANRNARHMAIRAASVGRIDGIDITVEHAGAPVHILRVS